MSVSGVSQECLMSVSWVSHVSHECLVRVSPHECLTRIMQTRVVCICPTFVAVARRFFDQSDYFLKKILLLAGLIFWKNFGAKTKLPRSSRYLPLWTRGRSCHFEHALMCGPPHRRRPRARRPLSRWTCSKEWTVNMLMNLTFVTCWWTCWWSDQNMPAPTTVWRRWTVHEHVQKNERWTCS